MTGRSRTNVISHTVWNNYKAKKNQELRGHSLPFVVIPSRSNTRISLLVQHEPANHGAPKLWQTAKPQTHLIPPEKLVVVISHEVVFVRGCVILNDIRPQRHRDSVRR